MTAIARRKAARAAAAAATDATPVTVAALVKQTGCTRASAAKALKISRKIGLVGKKLPNSPKYGAIEHAVCLEARRFLALKRRTKADRARIRAVAISFIQATS